MSTVVKTHVTELPESRVRVDAEVAPEEVDRSVQHAARELGRQMKIPGFRKGKVPPPVVIRRLGRDAVLDEALRTSLSDWYVDAIDEAGISPIGEPELDVGELPAEGKPLSFTIEIGVRPRATLGGYKGLEVGRRGPVADEAAIERELEQLRDRFATLQSVERPSEKGDYVVVDYVGTIDGEPFAGGDARDQLVEIGSERLVPGFEEQLIGAVPGEQRTIEIAFPTGYPAEHLAGRSARFDVRVTEVKAKILPDLDDELATEAAGFDNLAELREDIAKRLTEIDEHDIEHEFERAVLDAVADQAQIELPDALIHARAHELVEETLNAFSRQGISRDAYLRVTGRTEHELAHDAEPEAASQLRREAVIDAVVAAEGIEPSEDDLLIALERSATRHQTTPAKLLEQLRDRGGLSRLRAEVARSKAVELLVGEAKPITVAQASARDRLWTPEKGDGGTGSGQLWTPGA